MQQFVVITFMGAERKGIIRDLSSVAKEHGANWEGSRSASLAGRFAGIVQLRVAAEHRAALIDGLRALPGLAIVVEEGEHDPAPLRVLQLELTGHDRPGLVRAMSEALHDLGGNIEDLDTRAEEAPMAGGVIFRANARVEVPADVTHAAVMQALEALGDDVLIEIRLDDR